MFSGLNSDNFYNNKENEYTHAISDLIRIVREELPLLTTSLILYGSYAYIANGGSNQEYFLPGESDLDLVLVTDTGLSQEPFIEFQNIIESLNSVIFEPIYASLLDLTILEAPIDVPPTSGASFGLLQMYSCAKSGILLYGKRNFFQTIKYSELDLLVSSRAEVHKIYNDLKNAFLHRDMYRTPELFWLGVDSVLNSGLTYANTLNIGKNMTPLIKMQVSDFIDTSSVSPEIKDIIRLANDFRLNGGPADGHFNFFVKSLKFCRQINELLIKRINQLS